MLIYFRTQAKVHYKTSEALKSGHLFPHEAYNTSQNKMLRWITSRFNREHELCHS